MHSATTITARMIQYWSDDTTTTCDQHTIFDYSSVARLQIPPATRTYATWQPAVITTTAAAWPTACY
jgi:hypothetical protein